MKRDIALWTEWAWSTGSLQNNRQAIDSHAIALAQSLKQKYPHHFGSFDKSTLALSELIQLTLLKLSYGQHSPETLHPKRRAFLASLFSV